MQNIGGILSVPSIFAWQPDTVWVVTVFFPCVGLLVCFGFFLSDYDVLAALQTGSRYNQLKQWAVIAESVAAPLISSHYKHRRCVAIARRHRRGSKCMPDRRELSNKPCFAVYEDIVLWKFIAVSAALVVCFDGQRWECLVDRWCILYPLYDWTMHKSHVKCWNPYLISSIKYVSRTLVKCCLESLSNSPFIQIRQCKCV